MSKRPIVINETRIQNVLWNKPKSLKKQIRQLDELASRINQPTHSLGRTFPVNKRVLDIVRSAREILASRIGINHKP